MEITGRQTEVNKIMFCRADPGNAIVHEEPGLSAGAVRKGYVRSYIMEHEHCQVDSWK